MRIHIVVPPDTLRHIDGSRGDVSRSRWILRAIERALGADAAEAALKADPLRSDFKLRVEAFKAAEPDRWAAMEAEMKAEAVQPSAKKGAPSKAGRSPEKPYELPKIAPRGSR